VRIDEELMEIWPNEVCDRIEYLGLVISENQVSMDLVKVAGVREWPTLENKTDV